MAEFLPGGWLLVERERAADLRQHLGEGDRACPPVGIGDKAGFPRFLGGVAYLAPVSEARLPGVLPV
jgi:hypothetical protein